MSETATPYRVLQTAGNNDIMETKSPDMIQVSIAELDKEHSLLLARIHQLRRILKYPPLLTGKEIERQAQK